MMVALPKALPVEGDHPGLTALMDYFDVLPYAACIVHLGSDLSLQSQVVYLNEDMEDSLCSKIETWMAGHLEQLQQLSTPTTVESVMISHKIPLSSQRRRRPRGKKSLVFYTDPLSGTSSSSQDRLAWVVTLLSEGYLSVVRKTEKANMDITPVETNGSGLPLSDSPQRDSKTIMADSPPITANNTYLSPLSTRDGKPLILDYNRLSVQTGVTPLRRYPQTPSWMFVPEEFKDDPTSIYAVFASKDWEKTALGDPELWDEALVILVNTCMASNKSVLICWGPQYVII